MLSYLFDPKEALGTVTLLSARALKPQTGAVTRAAFISGLATSASIFLSGRRLRMDLVICSGVLAPEWYPIGGRVYLGLDPGQRLR